MAQVENLRTPGDKSAGGLHHFGRMLDKIRLMAAGRLPPDYHRNYGLAVGLDGQLCGFLNVTFVEVEARVREGGADADIVEWVFARGLRPSRTQAYIWNEHSRKLGWNDRISAYLQKQKAESGLAGHPACTTFELIDLNEGRTPPAAGG